MIDTYMTSFIVKLLIPGSHILSWLKYSILTEEQYLDWGTTSWLRYDVLTNFPRLQRNPDLWYRNVIIINQHLLNSTFSVWINALISIVQFPLLLFLKLSLKYWWLIPNTYLSWVHFQLPKMEDTTRMEKLEKRQEKLEKKQELDSKRIDANERDLALG